MHVVGSAAAERSVRGANVVTEVVPNPTGIKATRSFELSSAIL